MSPSGWFSRSVRLASKPLQVMSVYKVCSCCYNNMAIVTGVMISVSTMICVASSHSPCYDHCYCCDGDYRDDCEYELCLDRASAPGIDNGFVC